MNSRVDLHMHSKASDGSDTIPELLKKIQTLGIHTFAVTDHDKIDGAAEMEQIVPEDIRFIRGVELSCKTGKDKCHILGYNYDLNDKAFLAFVAEAFSVRINKTYNRLSYLEEKFGFRFTDEEKEEQLRNPGKPQLKKLLEKKLRELQPDAGPVDIYETYFKDMPGGRVDAARAIRAVKAAGGIAVWAHPLGGTGEKRLTKEQFPVLLKKLCDAGLDGLECCYSEYTSEESGWLCRAAAEHGLLVSGGSDYHGTGKPHLHPGMLNRDDATVQEKQLTVLRALN